MYDGWVWGAATWHGCAWCWFAQFSELGVDLIQPRVRGAECFRVLEGDADALEVAPGFRTLTRRVLRVCGPVGEDVLDGHEQEENIHAGVSP